MHIAHGKAQIELTVAARILVVSAHYIQFDRPIIVATRVIYGYAVVIAPLRLPHGVLEPIAPSHVVCGKLVLRIHNAHRVRIFVGNKRVARQYFAVYRIVADRFALLLYGGKIHAVADIVLVAADDHVVVRRRKGGRLFGHTHHFGEVERAVRYNFFFPIEHHADLRAGNVACAHLLFVLIHIVAPIVDRPSHFGPCLVLYRGVVPPSGSHHHLVRSGDHLVFLFALAVRRKLVVAVVIHPQAQFGEIAHIRYGGHVHDDVSLVVMRFGLPVERNGEVSRFFVIVKTNGNIFSLRIGAADKLARIFARFAHLHLARAERFAEIQHGVFFQCRGAVHGAHVFVVVGIAHRVFHVNTNGVFPVFLHLKAVARNVYLRFGFVVGNMKHLSPTLGAVGIARKRVVGHGIRIAFDIKRRQLARIVVHFGRGTVGKIDFYGGVFHLFAVGRIHKRVCARFIHRYRIVCYIYRLPVMVFYRF